MRYTLDVALELAVTSPDPEGRTTRRYRFARSQGPILLGRRGGCDVLLPLDDVEPVHARIENHQHSFCLVDMHSQLGTQLNGARIPSGRRLPLSEGDRIEIAGAVVDVRLDNDQLEELPDLGARVLRELFAILPADDAHPRLSSATGTLLLDAIGRTWVLGHQGNALQLDEVDMWREQVALERQELSVTVRPLSDRAILLNGRRLTEPAVLRDGDELKLGEQVATFRDPAARYETELATNEPPRAAEPVAAPIDRAPEVLAMGAVVCGISALAAILWILFT